MSSVHNSSIVCSLYEQLWRARGVPLLANNKGLRLYIPHTIVYRQSAPCGWYFSTKSGKLARRKRARLCNDEILSTFARKGKEPAAIWRQQRKNHLGKVIYSEVVLASDDVASFLRSDQIVDGVLQMFVKPGGEHMRFFRATWTKHICYIELVEKETPMNNTRASLRQRFTFSKARDTTSTLVRNASYIGSLIEYGCDSIVRRLGGHIENMQGTIVTTCVDCAKISHSFTQHFPSIPR